MNIKTRPETFVVIGGNAAGMSAASKAKRSNPNLQVIAYEKTPHVSYSACGIPYFVADLVREPSELISITPEQFREKRGIDVKIQHQVLNIDAIKRRILVKNLQSASESVVPYDKLLISVGGQPNRPDIPGIDLKNVFTIRTLQDGIRLKQFIDEKQPKRAVIIGGGYIAMEMAEALRERRLQVSILEKEGAILTGFEPEIREIVGSELEKHQVVVHTGVVIDSLAGENGAVQSVQLSHPKIAFPVDLAVVSTGIAAMTRLAQTAGVRTGSTGAIAVDWKMQTSVQNIFAAGDCVEVKNLVSGKPDYIPLGPTANKQGRVAGENIGGGTARFPGVVGTSVFKVFSLEVARTGLNVLQAQRAGFAAKQVTIAERPKAGYLAKNERMTIAIIFDERSGRLLGAQMVGASGVSKRIDVFAAALTNRLTLEEMAYLDMSYAPPFAPVWDPVLVAVNVARGKLRKR